MEATQYQNEFGRTLAPVFFPENVNPLCVGIILNSAVQLAKAADGAKRALYYNKTDRIPGDGSWSNEIGLPFNIDTEQLHALLGMLGELGEIIEILLGDDVTTARARLVDENGDLSWYQALLFKPWNITYQEIWDGNIAKLKKRYPGKFTIEHAVNRDLDAEAAVFTTSDLSGGTITTVH